ncbi:B12-binding domain-containing radical SAM protein [Candidatus Magnetomonas plexicatena]|uniref:B12-binding domain-containing radical SAM protein n=1 Tax=Candidatus Magnetomonas plexicatena TaxID=2552947 RepID=UPI001C75CD16|nr:radical SAM protein [Nitrospirales bacterium LBB_01]
MIKERVGLVQINNSFSNQNYFPLSVGLLQSYAMAYLKNPSDFQFLLPIYKNVAPEQAVGILKDASIVAFSVYVWNERLSLEIAAALKQRSPKTLIIIGGPSVHEDRGKAQAFLRTHPYVDILCHGAGEEVFVSILENFKTKRWQKVSSISFIDKEGKFISTPCIQSKTFDINAIPSPYLSGVFDPLMAANPDETWLALWETNRGCPFSCAYCQWGYNTNKKIYSFDTERLHREIDWFSGKRIEFIYCCDANYGILPRDIDIVNYVVKNKIKYGYPKAFSVQNTKNSTEKTYKIQKTLSDAGMNKGVTMSLQSLNPATLKAVNRQNISTGVFQELQNRFTADKIETYTDVILGLPEETIESFTRGVAEIIEKGQHNRIQFNILVILDNSEMGQETYHERYGFVVRETQIINFHGGLTTDSVTERAETQKIVVGTNTMPPADWLKVRAFGWITALIYFDKLLQIPLLMLHKRYGVRFKDILEGFVRGQLNTPVINEINAFFINKALEIQNGGAEYCASKEWLGIWWPADEYIFIKLCKEGTLEKFYEESKILLFSLLKQYGIIPETNLLDEAILLNHELIKRPFQDADYDIELSYNVWDYYRAVLAGDTSSRLIRGSYTYRIDRTTERWSSWEQWYKEVVWYGNKKGAYLYTCSQEVHR